MSNTISTLAQMKLDVIKYHAVTITTDLDGNEITNLKDLVSMANDACYTSHNSVMYVKKSIADALADYDIACENKNARDTERLERYLAILQERYAAQDERHQADVDVYSILTNGEQWQRAKPKASGSKMPKKDLSALRAVAAS